MGSFKKFFSWQNIEVVLALIVAVSIGVLNLLNGAFGWGERLELAGQAATLIVLSLLSFGFLRDRVIAREDREVAEDIKSHLERISPRSRQDLEIRDDFQGEVKHIVHSSEKELWCLLRTGSILYELKIDFQAALDRGCSMNVVVCRNDPELRSAIASQMSERVADVERKFGSGYDTMSEFEGYQNNAGRFSCRSVDHVPSVLMFFSDPAGPDGQVFVVPVAYQTNVRRAPSLRLNRAEHKRIFDHYREEFERYIHSSRDTELKQGGEN